MMDNERRADLGGDAIWAAASQTGVAEQEAATTAVTDVLAYIAHFCRRLGLDPKEEFESGLRSYEGDYEDGPGAEKSLDPDEDLPAPGWVSEVRAALEGDSNDAEHDALTTVASQFRIRYRDPDQYEED